jgi:cell division protein DivIC
MLKVIIKTILNKYMFSLLFMIVWVLFFDETDFFLQQKRLKELNLLEEKINYYKKEIKIAQQQLDDIKNNDESLEKFAREKYFMKKPGEDIFIIENQD